MEKNVVLFRYLTLRFVILIRLTVSFRHLTVTLYQSMIDDIQLKLKEYKCESGYVNGGYDVDFPDNYISISIHMNDMFLISDEKDEEIHLEEIRRYFDDPTIEAKKEDIRSILQKYNIVQKIN